MTSSLFIRGWQNERRTSFAMSKPAATAVIAFVTLLARLTLLPGVDAQFYQVRRDTPSLHFDRHLGTSKLLPTSSPSQRL